MWNETTNIIHVSLNVVWSKRMFFLNKKEEEEISIELLAIEKSPIAEARDISNDSKCKASTNGAVNDEALNYDDDADDLVDYLKEEDDYYYEEPPA